MGGEEGERETERLPGGPAAEKLEGVVFVFPGDVGFAAARVDDPMRFRGLADEVEFLRGKFPVVPLSNVPDVISVRPEQARIGLLPWRLEHAECRVPVAGHPLTRQQRSPAHAADGSGHTGLGEAQALSCEFVQFGCFYHRISRAAECGITPIVRVKHEDVQRLLRCAACLGKERGQEKENDGFH
jgi:hypothetical protein